ncbi:unnamed protein product [Arabidopsis halleri]
MLFLVWPWAAVINRIRWCFRRRGFFVLLVLSFLLRFLPCCFCF